MKRFAVLARWGMGCVAIVLVASACGAQAETDVVEEVVEPSARSVPAAETDNAPTEPAPAPETVPTGSSPSGPVAQPLLDADGQTISAFADPSLTLDTNDLAVVAWVDDAIHVLRCLNPSCSEVLQATPAGDDLGTPMVLVDSQDRPTLVYLEVNTQTARFFRCDEPSCDTGGQMVALPFDRASTRPQMALDGQDRLVVLSAGTTLELARCTDLECSPDRIEHTVIVGEGVSIGAALALDSDGFPVIVFGDDEGRLRLLRCDDLVCAPGGYSDTVLEDVTYQGYLFGGFPKLRIDPDENPVILATDSATRGRAQPVLIRCEDRSCTSATTQSLPRGVNPNAVGLDLDALGNPVVAFNDNSTDSLILVTCDDLACSPERTTAGAVDVVGPLGGSVDLRLDESGSPVIIHLHLDDNVETGPLHLRRCETPRCEAPS